MRAVVCRALRGPDALELADLPVPEPGACGVRIRVRAAGVNFADSLMLSGRYQEKPPCRSRPASSSRARSRPWVPACAGLSAGPARAGGGRARRLRRAGGGAGRRRGAPAGRHGRRSPPPASPSPTARRTAPCAGAPACTPARSLVVHGAGSGVGLTAVECGKAIGATVIATARGEDKLAVAREHGADHVLDSEDPDLKGASGELTAGRGADVVYDPVGGAVFDASLRAIAWEGRIVVVGFASGEVPQIPANLLLVKNAAVLGFYWGSYRKHDPERLRDGFKELFAWYRQGRIRPHVSRDAAAGADGRGDPPAGRAAQRRQGRGDRALADGRRVRRVAVEACAARRGAGLSQAAMNGAEARHRQPQRSSWSLRPWLLLRQLGLAFEEVVIPLRQPGHRRGRSGATRPAARCRCWWWASCGSGTRWRSPSSWPSTTRALARRSGPRGRWRARSAARCTAASRRCAPSCRWTSPPGSARRASCSPRSRATSSGSRRSGPTAGGPGGGTARSCSARSASRTPCSPRSARASPPTPCRSTRVAAPTSST